MTAAERAPSPIERAQSAYEEAYKARIGHRPAYCPEATSAAIAEYLRASADEIADTLGDEWNVASRLLFRLAAEVEETGK
jgi:hypothetical protein